MRSATPEAIDVGITHLRRIQPGNCKPCGTKYRRIQVDEKYSGPTDVLFRGSSTVLGGIGESTCAKTTYPLSHGTPIECPSAANAIECKYANQCCKL